MTTTPPTPADQVAAIKALRDLPAKVEAAAMKLLRELGADRVVIYTKRNDLAKQLGEVSAQLRTFGMSYEQQAERIGVHRNTLYHNGGTVELNSVAPKPGQQTRALKKLDRIAEERAANKLAVAANSEGMSDLVCFLFNQFRTPIVTLSETSQVKRSTLYGWLGLARHTATTDASGRKTRSLSGAEPEAEAPQPRKPGATGGGKPQNRGKNTTVSVSR